MRIVESRYFRSMSYATSSYISRVISTYVYVLDLIDFQRGIINTWLVFSKWAWPTTEWAELAARDQMFSSVPSGYFRFAFILRDSDDFHSVTPQCSRFTRRGQSLHTWF